MNRMGPREVLRELAERERAASGKPKPAAEVVKANG